jgi:hypothetical protein
MEELQECIDLCKATYESNTTSFMVGDSQLDLVKDIACAHFGDEWEDCWSMSMHQTMLDPAYVDE